MPRREGWDSRDDGPYWGCLIIAALIAVFWTIVIVQLGV